MIDFRVKIIDKITPANKAKQRALRKVPTLAYRQWVAHTPIRSGNARRKTVLKGETIEARYPYAQRLDEGYSKQAPDGMSKPVGAYIQRLVDTIMKRIR